MTLADSLSIHKCAWESGYWVVSEETVTRLAGADIYIHSSQLVASHFGGKILGYRIQRDVGEPDGRVVFRIEPSLAHRGVKTDREGWGNEKK